MIAPLWWQYLADTPWRWLDVVRHPWHGPRWWFRLWLRLPRPRYWRCNVRRRRALLASMEAHVRRLVASGALWRDPVLLRPWLRGDPSLAAWHAVATTWGPRSPGFPRGGIGAAEEWWVQDRGARLLLGMIGGAAQPAGAPGVRT